MPAYRVPRRFDIVTMLAVTAAYAGVFGILRWLDAWPAVFVVIGGSILAVSMAQMWSRMDPRTVSLLAGGLLAPATLIVTALVSGQVGMGHLPALLGGVAISIPMGGLLGYCIGALSAGVFLIVDLLRGRARRRPPTEQPRVRISQPAAPNPHSAQAWRLSLADPDARPLTETEPSGSDVP